MKTITATDKFCVTITNNFGKLAFIVRASKPNEAVKQVIENYYNGHFTQIETAPLFEPKQ